MKTLLAILILLSLSSSADTLSYKKQVFAYSALFVGGACEGFREVITHHFYKFITRFPNANQQFWNPAVSWQNKYNSRIPLARTLLVGTTDAYHLSNTIRNTFVFSYVFTIGRPKTTKQIIQTLIFSTVCYNAGKHFTWSLLFR